jgi:hypothetical protein
MSMSEVREVEPLPVARALAAVVDAPVGLLGLGMPRCGACLLLPASFAEIRRVRPGITAAIGEFASVEDWAERERLLWPRGIHVSRSSVPAMALLVDGEVIATRSGGGPATVIDAWLTPHLGPASESLPDGPTEAEREAFDRASGRIAHQRHVKRSRM